MQAEYLIHILAGEASGDILGAELMMALLQREPALHFQGIGGTGMQASGLNSMVAMERLSVMGLFEPLKRLPELLKIKRDFVTRSLEHRPAVFVGIDSPDFNLRVANSLHAQGIKTVHYVSPSVWAWRQKRVLKIKQSVDLMLTLFPFEEQFYQQHDVNVKFVGHPLADQMPLECDSLEFREQLQLDVDAEYLAVLPGSRVGESQRMMPVFLETMEYLAKRKPELRFLIPAANAIIKSNLEQLVSTSHIHSRIQLLDGQSKSVMGAANVVLLASGTSTLEAMLLKKPMVMAYKLSGLTYNIVKRMVKVPYFALPNLLASERIVEEFIQDDAKPQAIAEAVMRALSDEEGRLKKRFLDIHHSLRQDASATAANAILELF